MQAAAVFQDVLYNPGSGRCTNNQKDILPVACHCVPEVFKGGNEVGLRGLHPRRLVQKYHFLLAVRAVDEHLQGIKSLIPVRELGTIREPLLDKGCTETPELYLERFFGDTGVLEREVIIKHFPHEECLANASAAIYGNKL